MEAPHLTLMSRERLDYDPMCQSTTNVVSKVDQGKLISSAHKKVEFHWW
jgi:hypothetical protein